MPTDAPNATLGSSPRMRGTRSGSDATIASSRIIPAHAGNSDPTERSASCSTDHPRACGELPRMRLTLSTLAGSSPRMRGTRIPRLQGLASRRIIPAHAGNSASSRRATGDQPDHPRACGELECDIWVEQAVTGSSPRMRGTRRTVRRQVGFDRIIPAHAGNSARSAVSRDRAPDHPRACGELLYNRLLRSNSDGSSPRMRGTRIAHEIFRRDPRIIPAHAGNSLAKTSNPNPLTDHPRACGELDRKHVGRRLEAGSSPRMRGTHPSDLADLVPSRIIPAHAGNSVTPKWL